MHTRKEHANLKDTAKSLGPKKTKKATTVAEVALKLEKTFRNR